MYVCIMMQMQNLSINVVCNTIARHLRN